MVTFPLHSRNSWSCVLYLRLLRYSFFSIKTCFFKFLISYLHFSFFFLTIKFSWLAHSIPRRQGGLIHILGFSKICPLFFSFFLFLFWILNFFFDLINVHSELCHELETSDRTGLLSVHLSRCKCSFEELVHNFSHKIARICLYFF